MPASSAQPHGLQHVDDQPQRVKFVAGGRMGYGDHEPAGRRLGAAKRGEVIQRQGHGAAQQRITGTIQVNLDQHIRA